MKMKVTEETSQETDSGKCHIQTVRQLFGQLGESVLQISCCKLYIASDHSQSSMEEGMLILGSLMTSEIVQSRKYSLTHRFYSITT